MLLTKPLTNFLSQNTSPQLPTLLLISPSGKLLSSSSPLPASILRTQSTIASTLWNNNAAASSLSLSSKALANGASSSTGPNAPKDNDLSSITIQLSHGIMVIRFLSCGLLFVAIGPTAPPFAPNASPHANTNALPTSNFTSSHTSPPCSPPAQHNEHEGIGDRHIGGGAMAVIGSEAPSIAGSVGSSVVGARAQASILGVKRQADEVGKWLENKLQGFASSYVEGR